MVESYIDLNNFENLPKTKHQDMYKVGMSWIGKYASFNSHRLFSLHFLQACVIFLILSYLHLN
jgi:hypothetical protein